MSNLEESKDIFVGKVLGEVLSTLSDLRARVEVLTEEVVRLRTAEGAESEEEVIEELERRVDEVENARLDEVTRRFTE